MKDNTRKFYVEYWTVGDSTKTVEANSFHINPKYLVSFLRKLIKAGRYLVHVQQGTKVLYSTRHVGHRA